VPILTEADYAEQRREMGRTIHENDGVWWETLAPFYTKPAFEFKSFLPKTAKPRWSKSFFGYSHQVPDRRYANRILEYMILEGEDLRHFSMASLRSEKRNQVRKGLKMCEVRPVLDLESCLEDLRQINIAQAKRLMEDETFCLPYTYYVEHEREWKSEMRRLFAMPGHDWWGAFHQGILVAYMVTCHVENIRLIQFMKTHTDHLRLCATDAIYFTALENACRDPDCHKIVNGAPAREGLNRFKAQFLFKPSEVFYFTSGAIFHNAAKRLLQHKDVLRARVLRAANRGMRRRKREALVPSPQSDAERP